MQQTRTMEIGTGLFALLGSDQALIAGTRLEPTEHPVVLLGHLAEPCADRCFVDLVERCAAEHSLLEVLVGPLLE